MDAHEVDHPSLLSDDAEVNDPELIEDDEQNLEEQGDEVVQIRRLARNAKPTSSRPDIRYQGMFRALFLFRTNRIKEAEEECTKLLNKNPLDQAAWALKLQCQTDSTYVDELENDEMGIAEALFEQNVIAPNARPGTSFQRPTTTAAGGVNPITRPMSQAGRPITGVSRPVTSFRPGTTEQAMRNSRTAKTARPVSSSTARQLRLGTASMAANPDGPFVNLARLNIDKYASDAMVNRQLFEYVFYNAGDIKIAHQIASVATKAANYEDWYWKNQLAKCYFRLGMYDDAEKQLDSSLKNHKLVETWAFLAKICIRRDQPLNAIKHYENGLLHYPNDVTLLLGLARCKEMLGEMPASCDIYRKLLVYEATNIEAIACVAANMYYDDKPEIALNFYRRIMQMGVTNAELLMNIGLCCHACQQFDFAVSSICRAHAVITDDVAGDIWYNTSHVFLAIGNVKTAGRCLQMAIAADPEHAEALNDLAILKQREGRLEHARSLYHNSVRCSQFAFEPRFNLALLSYQMGLYEESRETIKTALEIFPDHSHALMLKESLDKLYFMV